MCSRQSNFARLQDGTGTVASRDNEHSDILRCIRLANSHRVLGAAVDSTRVSREVEALVKTQKKARLSIPGPRLFVDVRHAPFCSDEPG